MMMMVMVLLLLEMIMHASDHGDSDDDVDDDDGGDDYDDDYHEDEDECGYDYQDEDDDRGPDHDDADDEDARGDGCVLWVHWSRGFVVARFLFQVMYCSFGYFSPLGVASSSCKPRPKLPWSNSAPGLPATFPYGALGFHSPPILHWVHVLQYEPGSKLLIKGLHTVFAVIGLLGD